MERLIEAIDRLKEKPGFSATIPNANIAGKTFVENLDELSEPASDKPCSGADLRYSMIAEIHDPFMRADYGS
ncbi:MAG: hypothetical protein GF344_16915 [Chitinivibrionales bacterium]|nr:hypothetical protein [Chitinivibrionales bacterium]MBD3358364.1 hypothetical protein [Chitinivibrionales bacterium]